MKYWLMKSEPNTFSLKDLKNAKLVDRYGIYLPNHANLSSDDINYVSKEFKLVAVPFKF